MKTGSLSFFAPLIVLNLRTFFKFLEYLCYNSHLQSLRQSEDRHRQLQELSLQERDKKKRLHSEVMNGQQLRLEDPTFDITITSFGIFFVPKPVEDIRQSCRSKTWRNSGENLLGKWNIAEKGVLIRGEDSVELIAGLVDNLKGMVGQKWSEDEEVKAKEATKQDRTDMDCGKNDSMDHSR